MRSLVVYESMYGNTHTVAERIGAGLAARCDVRVVPVGDATHELIAWADVVVVGGPTHVHGMTSAMSRKGARDGAFKPGSGLHLDADAEGPGLREWIKGLPVGQGKPAVAFDTRMDAAAAMTGRACRGIARRLRSHGFDLVAEPESFLVDKKNRLVQGEADRATHWGARLAEVFVAVS
jgi:hypothetical protein